MSTAQKIIKYLAIAFGVFLSVTIVSSLVMGIIAFTEIFTDNEISNDSVKQDINITDYYDKDLYSIYLSGVLPQQFITNKDNEEGLKKLEKYILFNILYPIGRHLKSHNLINGCRDKAFFGA